MSTTSPAQIARVVLWSNGTVSVWDTAFRMPEYEGHRFLEVRDQILRDASPRTIFEVGHWGGGTVPVSREAFGSSSWGGIENARAV